MIEGLEFRVGEPPIHPPQYFGMGQTLTLDFRGERAVFERGGRVALDVTNAVRVSAPNFELFAAANREGEAELRRVFEAPREETWTVSLDRLGEFLRKNNWVNIEKDPHLGDYVKVTVRTYEPEKRPCP